MSQNQADSILGASFDQNKQVAVDELSGDQGMQKTVMVTFNSQCKANLFETSTSVVKCIVGSGIISLPYTVSVMGWALSIVLFSLVGIANQYTIHILLKAKNLSKHSTYNSIAYHIYKSKYCTFLLSFINMFANIGFVVAMLSILKSTLRKLVLQFIGVDSDARDAFYTSQQFITVVVALCIVPGVLVKRVQSLKYLSVIGVFALVLAIIFLIIIFFIQMSKRTWQNSFTMIALPNDGLAVLSVFPNIMFALVFQSNFFSLFKGLEKSTDKRIIKATGAGIGFSTFLYILLGFMGYCLYGSENQYVEPNFLLQIKREQIHIVLYVGIYLGFLVCDLLCIPITFLVARNNLIAIIKMFKVERPGRIPPNAQYSAIQQIGSFTAGQNQQQIKKKAKILFYVYTLSLYFIYVLITILVQSLAAVFNIVGAIASSAISFIIPCLFYVLLIKQKKKPKNRHYFICAGGIVLFVPLGILSVVSLYV